MPTAVEASAPPPSAISSLFKPVSSLSNPPSSISPSQTNDQTSTHLHNLAIQIKHNLEHQHRWTDLRIHTETYTTNDTTINGSDPARQRTRHVPPRPLLSGLPPTRLYMHPDEQIALLTKSTNHSTASGTDQSANEPGKELSPAQTEELSALIKSVKPEREWVLPSHLNEKWSLRRFGEVFDAVDHVPPVAGSVDGDDADDRRALDAAVVQDEEKNPWRTVKRVLLATVDTDSTIAYYLVHDGIVKPRQN